MNRNKKVTYFINIKKAGNEFFDDKIDYILSDIYRIFDRRDIEIILIDENGVSDSAMNEIAERFISQCLDESGNYAIPYPHDGAEEFCWIVKDFLENLFRYAYKERHVSRDDRVEMDVIAPNGWSFKVALPEDQVSESTCDKLLALGPELLETFMDPFAVFTYIIPAYFFFLCENGAFDDPVLGAFDLYLIGLH